MKDYRYGPYDKLIESTVARMSIRDEFKPFVIDALKRRAFQFNFTNAQVTTDLARLSRSLTQITANPGSLTTAGVFYPSKGKININALFLGVSTNKSLYATFTHELYHALASVKGWDRMTGTNQVTGYQTYSLTEALVEASSYSTVYPTKSRNPYFNGKISSYYSISFAPEMLCATFGVNKQELLAHAIQDRSELDRFLAQKSGLRQEEVFEFMNDFETNMDAMHEALYGGRFKNRLPWVRGKICEDSLKILNAKCFSMMERSFARMDSSSLTPEKFEDLKFNFNKLLAVTKAGCRTIGANPLNAGFSTRRVMQGFEQSGSFYKNGIIQTEYYEDFKKTHEIPPRIKEIEHLVRYGTFNRFGNQYPFSIVFDKIKQNIGLEMPETTNIREMFKVSKETIARNNPKEEKLEEWDNEFLKHHNLRLACIKARFKDRIEGLKRLVGIKPKPLPPGGDQRQEYTVEDLNRDSAKPIDELRVEVNPSPQKAPESPVQQKSSETEEQTLVDEEEEEK